MLPKFRSFGSSDVELNRLQENISENLNRVNSAEILDYNIVTNVSLAIGDNVVNHLLGRAPIGWFVVRKRGPGNFYDKQDSNPTPTRNYIINSDSAVTVDLYFF
jgi:hypothetical protein